MCIEKDKAYFIWKKPMNITVDGYNISYKITGEGTRTAVMLQGWGTDHSIYDLVAKAFDENWRFVQFDLPGFGASDEPKEPWCVDDYADFFCDFMKELHIEKATLLGHSYGGRIIIKLANRTNLPFCIERIVLMDSAGIMPKRSFKQKLSIRRYKIKKKILNQKVIHALFPEVIDDWNSRQGSEDYRRATPVMKSTLVKSVNEDLTDLLPGIKQDTLLIWGDKDTATPISDAKLMEEKIQNSGLCVLEGCGHYAFLEKPAQFLNIMRSYFKEG